LLGQFVLATERAPVQGLNGLSNGCEVIFIDPWLVDRKPLGLVWAEIAI
jgi:hypothetical protein